ncbi:MAG TPA: cobalamin-independent methionine synthase II family protein, partial [Roseiflexaceae bacterium]|nr:cobalamin-independent methionine synthase II family protein [Roseiflexaceae bacterium]
PDYLKDARRKHEAGELGDAEFKQVEDRSVDDSIALQNDAGLDVITDGEMRRFAFFGHLIDAVEGYDRLGGWAIPFRNEQGDELILQRPVVVSKLKRIRPMCTEEFVYMRARTDRPVKVTLINAQQAAAYYDPEKSKGAYANIDAYLADVVDILRTEIDELVRLGCTYIQVDAPQYAALIDPDIREGYRKRGNDPDKLLDRCIELDNAVIGDHPGVTFGIHLCRGNNQSRFYASGGYDPITSVFERTRFDRFLLEYDDERSGNFEPLQHVPEDRTVVLGLVTTKKPRLETKDELKRRIDEASQYVPLERLALSPQCGFASTEAGNLLSEADQEAKLRIVAEVAREVWGNS